jgi:hypothetical protein
MGKRYLPTVEALTDNDDDRLIAELRVREVREQVAIARSLLDAVEVLSANERASEDEQEDPAERAAAELARLGCKIVELAGAISRSRGPVSAVSPVQRAS